MKYLMLPLIAVLWILPARAQLHIPSRQVQSVLNPANVFMDRGSRIEIFPTQRAAKQQLAGTQAAFTTAAAAVNAPIGPLSLGVVFNYEMQQQGYISGEIAFKMKAGNSAVGFATSQYPALKKIASPQVYVVNTRTPTEFLAVLKRLQARSDLAWVEPMITYGRAASEVQPGTLQRH